MIATAWPFKNHLELGAFPSAVPCARLHARQMVWKWGLPELADTVELVTSELVTNAVLASEGLVGYRHSGRWTPGVPPVRLWLRSDNKSVLIQVWDANNRMPVRQEIGDVEAEGGRGLLLVEALSEEWGSYVPEAWRGKVVWAECSMKTP